MRVRIQWTEDFDNDYRRALAWYYSADSRVDNPHTFRLATREEIRRKRYVAGTSEDDDIMSEWNHARDRWDEEHAEG